MMSRELVVICCVGMFVVPAMADQTPIREDDVCQDDDCTGPKASTYIGAGFEGSPVETGLQGAVQFGGDVPPKAYDFYGMITDFGGLTVERRVETFTDTNIYRWIDTYTNPTANRITTTVQFFGDLATDHLTKVESSDDFVTITSDTIFTPSHPVIAHIYGNNQFTKDHISADVGVGVPGQMNAGEGLQDDNFRITIDLDLFPLESTSIAILNFLAFDPTTRPGGDSDLDLAMKRADQIVNSGAHVFRGLTTEQRHLIVNFVPLPSSANMGLVLLLGLGVVTVVFRRRREMRET